MDIEIANILEDIKEVTDESNLRDALIRARMILWMSRAIAETDMRKEVDAWALDRAEFGPDYGPHQGHWTREFMTRFVYEIDQPEEDPEQVRWEAEARLRGEARGLREYNGPTEIVIAVD